MLLISAFEFVRALEMDQQQHATFDCEVTSSSMTWESVAESQSHRERQEHHVSELRRKAKSE